MNAENLVGPAIAWFDLSPLLVLLGASLVLLVLAALTPAWPRGLYAAFTATAAGAAMVMSFVLWDDVTDEGARTLVDGAVSLDTFALFATIAVSAAILLASKEYADKHGLKPRARIVAMTEIGDCPTLMLNAPVPAAKKVLQKAGLTKDDIDVWEVNEAFAVVVEKMIRDLGLDRTKVNPNGGSIALGHPIAGTGAILIGTALDELERTGGRYGLITMCAAGGMAPAIIIERV